MNHRDYKQFAAGEFFHIYNRGVGKMNIFRNKEDFNVFLSRLKENVFPEFIDKSKLSKTDRKRKMLPPNSFDVVCYCLMPNHFHLLIKQLTDLSISKLVSKLCSSYSLYFNKKYDRVGALFQDQFKSVLIKTNEQLLWTSLYIHKNPLKAVLVKNIEDYAWNSYLDYAGLKNDGLCKKEIILDQYRSSKEYLKQLRSEQLEKKLITFADLFIDAYDEVPR